MIGAKYPNPKLPWPLPLPDVGELATDEGCRLVSYRHFPDEPWTNGWGETDGVGPGMVWTQEYADQRFCDSMTERVNAVRAACTRMPTPNQLCAMVRLSYNIGLGWEGEKRPPGAKKGFRQSTVLKQHNAGNFAAAAEAFALWDKISDGKGGLVPLDALHARRLREAAQYLTPEPDAPREPMPQVVAPESTMTSSPIVKGAVVAGGASVIDLVAEAGKNVETVKPVIVAVRDVLANAIGLPPAWLLPAMVLAACAFIVHWRLQQRREGRA